MHNKQSLVINTGPIIAIIAALGSLEILKSLYSRVIIPYEVLNELLTENASRFGAIQVNNDKWIEKRTLPTVLSPFLKNSLDPGEASVIQLALNENIQLVCIDESVGRRVARLSNLKVTGSLGLLIKAKKQGIDINIDEAITNMRDKGIHIGKDLELTIKKTVNELQS